MSYLDSSARTGRRALSTLILAIVFPTLFVPASARAVDVYWIGTTGGYSYESAKWSYNGNPLAPGPQDNVYFNITNTYNLSWNWPVDSVAWLFSYAGKYRFNIPGRFGIGYGAYFNPDSVTFLSGTMRAGWVNFSYQGSGTKVLATNQAIVEARDSTNFSIWANSGYQARMTFNGGSRFGSEGWIKMAPDSGGRCSLTVIGASSFFGPGSLVWTKTKSPVNAERGNIYAGDWGNSVVQLMNAGHMSAAGDLYIGSGRSGVGLVHVFNSNNGIGTPHLTVYRDTYIGSNRYAGVRAGNGTLLVERGYASLYGITRIGGKGTGLFTLRNGTSLFGGGMWIVPEAMSGTGSAHIRGLNTHVTLTSSLSVGGTPYLAAGVPFAQLDLDSSAALEYTGTLPVQVWAPAQLLITRDAFMNSTANLEVNGFLLPSDATLQAPLTRILGGGQLNGTGTIRGSLELATSASLHSGLTGTSAKLTAGDSTSNSGCSLLGTTTVDDTLVLLDHDGVDMGTVNLNSGTLRVLPGGAHLLGGKTLIGNGLVDADFTNDGTVNAVIFDLNFTKKFTQLGGVTQGSGKVHILPTGSLTARGSMNMFRLDLDGPMDLGPTTARLSIGSSLLMAPGASARLRVGSKASGVRDTLAIGGDAGFNGLLDLRSIPGNPPVAGDTITMATMSSNSHQFTSVTVDGAPGAQWVTVQYSPTSMRVIFKKNIAGVADDPGTSGPPRALRFSGAGTPRNPSFALQLPGATRVRVTAYDVTGRALEVLADGVLTEGRHEFAIPRGRLPSGICFARAVLAPAAGSGESRTLTARVLLLR